MMIKSPSVVSEEQDPAWLQVFDDIPGHGLHLAGTDGGEDEDEGDHVQAVRGEGGLPVLGDVTDPGLAPALPVLRVVLHQLDGRLGEITAVDHQVRPGVHLQDGEDGGAGAAADLQQSEV